jgi:hypothetical protein
MAKDAQGHGSEAGRGGGSYPNIDRSAFRKGQHVGYGAGTFRIAKVGGGYRATEQRTGESFSGTSLGHISQQLTDRAANAAAATALSGNHAKSTAVNTHPAMNYGSNPDFVKKHGLWG